jgi:hypothetical protein
MQMNMPTPAMRKMSLWQKMTGKGYAPWAVQVGPFLLGLASLAFSLYSANAIRWVFSGLGVTDRLESIMVWVIAGAFGVTGYFITRGLAYRMMNKERIAGYIFICFLVEMVEISCNLLEALVAMQHSTQFAGFPPGVHMALTILVCVMWSCVPLISIGLAILDMDMEREKRGLIGQPKAGGAPPGFSVAPVRPQASFGPAPAATYPSMPQPGYGPVSASPLAESGRRP